MALADKLRGIATTNIDKYGIVASWHKDGTSVPVPGSGTVTTTADPNSPYTLKMTPPQAVTRFVDGEVIYTEDFSTTISGAQSFTPAVGDKVTLDGSIYRVLSVEAVYSGVGSAGTNIIAIYTVVMSR
jgi:hypothetical protein